MCAREACRMLQRTCIWPVSTATKRALAAKRAAKSPKVGMRSRPPPLKFWNNATTWADFAMHGLNHVYSCTHVNYTHASDASDVSRTMRLWHETSV